MTPERFALVGYLSGILHILESREDAGQDRGGALAREYTRAYDKLRELIKAEEKEQK